MYAEDKSPQDLTVVESPGGVEETGEPTAAIDRYSNIPSFFVKFALGLRLSSWRTSPTNLTATQFVSDDGFARDYLHVHEGVIHMLVIRRKMGERIQVGPEIELTVLDIRKGRVKLGFSGPRDVDICREELLRRDATAHADSGAERWVELSSKSAT